MPTVNPAIVSVRPEVTADLMERTGLDEAKLERLVHCFYAKVRNDAVLAPVFADRIADWGPHLDRMIAFWSSVALMTGRYSGAPMAAHQDLPVDWPAFERWLMLFRETAAETCPPQGAAHVVAQAERIARSLHAAIACRRSEIDVRPVTEQDVPF
ncbi:preprotein translocase [Zhengella mangrovi]|uniref:Preprotein translocase n=1 Tax=Zhengella mangrovi TaxID=1982044 RepID=A0A2G1QPQ9_9HYPH|nr:group III truncated hemoglobin [Zhengella mangrovi]PHP67208.1 preprotein translocase [Zhengella mangrovi]